MGLRQAICRCFDEIRNTGERPLINTMWEDVDLVLRFSYKFAAEKVAGDASVLDFGCGGGYGAEYLSRATSNTTVGFDADSATIRKNRIFFKDKPNLFFTDAFADLKHYDVVVFSQVIEHLTKKDAECCLKTIKGLLNGGGTFFLATVNKNITSHALSRPIMPFHVHEYTPDELSGLLKRYFSKVACYGQIDGALLEKVRSGEWSYQRDYDSGPRRKFIRGISQVGLIRSVARHLPLFVKSLLLSGRVHKEEQADFKLVSEPGEIANSYILIYECRI